MPAACFIEGIRGGSLCVTRETIDELLTKGIIYAAPEGTVGLFFLREDREDELWAFLRKRAS